MNKLREFANAVFSEYNREGSRTATNIEEVSMSNDRAVFHYDYTSLGGKTRRLSKTFKYDEDGNITHDGPIEI